MNPRKLKDDFTLFARSMGVPSTNVHDFGKYQEKNNQITPYIIEERDRRFTQIDILTYLIGQRIVSVNGAIGEDMVSILRAQLLYLEELNDEQDIQMYIDTPGGSVHAGLSLYDTMNYVANDIATTNFGMCASMGSVLVSSGTRGKRSGLPNSTIMIHQLSGGMRGHFEDMEISHQQSKIANDRLFTILGANCGKTKDEILAIANRDHWMWGKEAIEFGAIDFIIPSNKKNKDTNNLIFY
jgi:ATP-dependent Clp protease protease subunit